MPVEQYELKPYVSQYVNPFKAESAAILRERWDTNKAAKDTIDVTLGAMDTLKGDKHLVESAKGQVRDKMSNYVDQGNWEDSGLLVSEVMTDLESDRGLRSAKLSFAARKQELDYMNEATIKTGANFLDFGRGSADTHVSYYKNEEGEYVENVYQPLNESEQDYAANMASMVGNIKADYTGISRRKADAIAAGLTQMYLQGTVGDQDYRRLTQIEGFTHDEALTDINQRMQSLTDQQIHMTKQAAITNGAHAMSGSGALNKGYTAMQQAGLTGKDYGNKILSLHGDVFRDLPAGDKWKAAKEMRSIDNSVARESLTPEEYELWKKNQNLFRGHNEFGSYMEYATTQTWNPTYAADDDFDAEELGSAIGVGTVLGAAAGLVLSVVGAALTATGLGAPIGLPTLAAGATMVGYGALAGGAIGAVGDSAYQGGKMLTSESGNVRDTWNPQQGDGMLFGMLDSEAEELAANLNDVEHINELLGTDYQEGEATWEQLKKNAQAFLLYKQQGGGDELTDKMNNYDGDIFEAETWVPDIYNKEMNQAIGSIEKNWDPEDWDIFGVPELSSRWEGIFDPDGEGKGPGDADIEFRGIVAPSEVDDTELMFKWSINGDTYLAKPKANSPQYQNLLEQITMGLNKADLIILDQGRQWINYVEESQTGEGKNKEATGAQFVDQLTRLHQAHTGSTEQNAYNWANSYIFGSYERAYPNGLNNEAALLMQEKGLPTNTPFDKLSAGDQLEAKQRYMAGFTLFKEKEVRG